MKNIFFLLTIIIIFLITGCGKKDTVNTQTKDNSYLENKMPSDFPPDIPQYKGSKVISSAKTQNGTAVTFQIDDKTTNVIEFYKSEMSKNGYVADKTLESMLTDKGGVITYKKNGREFSFTYGYDDKNQKTSLVMVMR